MKNAKPVGVRLSSIAHATEDPNKVLSAIFNVYPSGSSKQLEIAKAKGHFGNEIKIFRLKNRGVSQAESFLEKVLGGLSHSDRLALCERLDEHLDPSGSLHLRFDKQEAFRGSLVLGDSDAIKVEVSFRSRGATSNLLREIVSKDLKELLNGPQGTAREQ